MADRIVRVWPEADRQKRRILTFYGNGPLSVALRLFYLTRHTPHYSYEKIACGASRAVREAIWPFRWIDLQAVRIYKDLVYCCINLSITGHTSFKASFTQIFQFLDEIIHCS